MPDGRCSFDAAEKRQVALFRFAGPLLMELREKLGIPEIPHPIGIKEIRRSNLRALIAKTTAVKLAAQLGYRQSSYLSEMAGPNPILLD
jgi:hypothetical protein